MTDPTKQKPPKELDAIVDLVFAYKAKPKTEPAKKRKKKSAKIAKVTRPKKQSLDLR